MCPRSEYHRHPIGRLEMAKKIKLVGLNAMNKTEIYLDYTGTSIRPRRYHAARKYRKVKRLCHCEGRLEVTKYIHSDRMDIKSEYKKRVFGIEEAEDRISTIQHWQP